MSRSLIAALLAILGLTVFGLYERHVGAQHAQAVLALQADSVRQDSTLRARTFADSVSKDSLRTLSRLLGASQAQKRALALKADSLANLVIRDTNSLIPRAQVVAIIASYQAVIRQDSVSIGILVTSNGKLAALALSKDSTIASLDAQLTNERHATAKALQASQPGFLGSVSGYVVKGLAVYGLIRLVRG